MAPLSAVSFSLLLSIFGAVTFKSAVLGDCSFPATYTNKFWFRMYSDSAQQKYIYRIFTSNVDDMRNDNATLFKNHYPCSSIVTDSTDPNTVYYLYDNYGIQTCAKSVITSDSSSILLQEVAVNSTVTDASQCIALILPGGSLWMSVVSGLNQPPPFVASSLCPFPGLFQMTASLLSNSSSSPSTVECSGDAQSTAIFYGSNVQLNLCGQGTLRNTTFKSKTVLAQEPLTCMASLDGRALNSNETGSTIVLLRDSNAIYCARYRNVSVGLELSINVKNDANYAGCFFTATSTNPVLQLILTPVTSTPGLSTTTTPLSTASLSVPTTTSMAASSASSTTTSTSSTVTGSSTTGSTGTGTGSTTTSSTSTSSITSPASVPTSSTSLPTSSTSLPTTPYTTTSTTTPTTPVTTQSTTTTTTVSTTSLVTPGPTSSTSPGVSTTTTRGTSKGPPEEIVWPSDNCPATPCGAPATCNEATHNCTCQTLFYTYSSNSSRCVQDDRSIDDTFLKIVVPVIATAVIGSLIAALALCFATSSSLDATALDGAALAAASADGAAPAAPAVGSAVQPPLQTIAQENPVFVSYGRNDTYANLDTIDRSLVTYGDQPTVAPPLPPSNYVLVGSSIPAKM